MDDCADCRRVVGDWTVDHRLFASRVAASQFERAHYDRVLAFDRCAMAPTGPLRRRGDDSLDSERRNFISPDALHIAQLPARIPSRCVARLSSSLDGFGEPRSLRAWRTRLR